jgi:aromatic ring-cleaving dioxygenase
LRFCFHPGKTATEALEMLQRAFNEEALSRTQVFKWFVQFKRGEMCVEDHPHSERPSTSHTNENVEKKFEKKSTRIIGTQLMRSQKLQVWVGVPVRGF